MYSIKITSTIYSRCFKCLLKVSCDLLKSALLKFKTRTPDRRIFLQCNDCFKRCIILVYYAWKMEGIISEAKQRHCLSRAKYRGLMKTQIQAYMVGSVLNMKRLVAFFILLFIYAQIRKLFYMSNTKRGYAI